MPKRRLFGLKMTSYVENATSYDKNFFFKIFNTSRGTTFSPTVLPENDIKRVKNRENCQKMRFSYKSYIKSLLNGFLTRLLLTTPLPTTFIGKNLVFLNPCDIPQLKNTVKKFSPPLRFGSPLERRILDTLSWDHTALPRLTDYITIYDNFI